MLSRRQREILEFITLFLREEGRPPTVREIASHFGLAVSTVHEHLERLRREGYLIKDSRGRVAPSKEGITMDRVFAIPFYGYVAAGSPISAEGEVFDYVDLSELVMCDNCYALRVKGNSMIEDHILDGDILIVEKVHEVPNGAVAVVLIDGTEATLKRFFKLSGNLVKLVPENPDMEPIVLPADRVQVQGILRGIVRSYRRKGL
jgi:repressor LexA